MTTMRALGVCLLLVVGSTAQATRVLPRSAILSVGTRMAEMATQVLPGGRNESLTTLLEALNNAAPELAEVLAGQQPFTVFAPADEVRAPSHTRSKRS
jgi:uncharacterized surface protein with fasciclin (FAS1) repeats